MEPDDNEALRAKYLSAAYWPWPLAFAYCQAADVRMASVDAAIHVFEEYPRLNMDSYIASSAVARVYEVATGRSYGGHPVEKIAADGEPYTVKSGEQVYWEEVAEIEIPLVGAIKAGQIDTWGRKAKHGKLYKLETTDWVGAEVDPDSTSDLVKSGWRVNSRDLSALFGEIERHAIAYDIHLLGAAVRQLVAAYDKQLSDCDDPIFGDWENSDKKPREGYWSLFVVAAWIVSRSDKFVAAVQEYEAVKHLDLGGCHSGGAWIFLDNLMGQSFDVTLSDAVEQVRPALETGRLQGGVGCEVNSSPRPIGQHEWKGWSIAHDHHGMAVLPGVYDVGWISNAVRDAFPAERTVAPEVADPTLDRKKNNGRRPTPQQQEVFRFFGMADGMQFMKGQGKEQTQSALFDTYKDAINKGKVRGEPYGLSRFKEMLVKYHNGWRVESGRWTEKTD